MTFYALRTLCNARYYALEAYGANGSRKNVEIDVEGMSYGDEAMLRKCDAAEVTRFQPYITEDGEPGLEVELNI